MWASSEGGVGCVGRRILCVVFLLLLLFLFPVSVFVLFLWVKKQTVNRSGEGGRGGGRRE